MRRFIISISIAAVIVIAIPVAILLFNNTKNTYGLDVVEVNELISEIEKNWGNEPLNFRKFSFEFAIVNEKGRLLYRDGDSTGAQSVVKATSSRDTIRDIVVNEKVVGHLIIYNHFNDIETRIEKRFLKNYIVSVSLVFLLVLAAILWIEFRVVRPFYKMKDFAEAVATGNLDKPLEMDRKNMFGAFTESFDIMREELKISKERELQANISKKELVAELSHDIKTPVASIKAMSEILSLKEDRDELRDKIKSIGEKADHIDSLVSNLFTSTLQELERMETYAIDLESTCISDMIKTADNRGLVNEFEIPECLIRGDRTRLNQVITNIIFNSYKYANTEIDVAASIEMDSLIVSFTDKGGGVSEEELSIITQKYKRGKNAEGIQGTGLGLFISKELMSDMEGSLEVANADGGFRVTLSFKMA